MRPIQVYSVFTTEASFDPANFTTTQCPISPFTPHHPRTLPFWEVVCQCITFEKIPLPTEEDFEDEEDLPTTDLDDPVWSQEPVSDNQEYLCIHEIPRPATPPNQPPHPTSHPNSLYQWPHPSSPIKESQPHHPSNLTK